MITFTANIRSASAATDDAITTSSVGIPVTLDLSADFDGLAKTLCFKTPSAAVDIALTGDATESAVPPDVLVRSGEWLNIGIYAADSNGDIVIPTVWANAGVIQLGTIPSGVDPSAPTPSWVAQVQQMAGDALNNSEQAIDTANEAKEAAITAQDSARASAAAAAQSATDAESAEMAAANSAGDAAASATAASGSVQIATEKASEAAASAAAAGTASDTATGKAVEAAQSADSAAQSAETAQNSAQAAQNAQTAAAGSASTASEKAGEAAQSASQAGNSATSASASATAAQAAQTAAEEAQTAAETAQSAAEQAAQSISDAAAQIQKNTDDILSIYPTDTASGSIASFADGAEDVPVKSLVVNIAPVQSGTGDPSPTNVRPISGWDGVTVWRTGKNLYPASSIQEYVYSWYSHPNFADAVHPIFLKAGTTYVVSGERDPQYSTWFFLVRMFDTQGNNVTDVSKISGGIGTFTYNYVAGGKYFQPSGSGSQMLYQTITPAIDCYVDIVAQSGRGEATNAMVEIGSTPTAYVPYNGRSISISFGQTVYGGTLDVVNGKMTVDRAMVTLDGSEEWYADGGNRYRTRRLDALVKSGRTEVLSNIGIFSNIETGVGTIFLNPVNGVGNIYYYPPTSITTVNEFKAWLSTNNMQVVYPLATPFELTLTPEQISTLQGINNVWSDAGDVDVTYQADVQLYVNKKTAQTLTAAASMLSNVETGMTATRAYAVNDFLSVNGQLYRVTAAIANGATITPGTNVTETTVGAQITALLNA